MKALKLVLILIAVIVGLLLLISPIFAIQYFLGVRFGLIEADFATVDIAVFYIVAFLILYFDWLAYRKYVKGAEK